MCYIPGMKILLTGATGYIGGQLLPRLSQDHQVRCMVRKPEGFGHPYGCEVVRGDVLSGWGLEDALEGVDVAYYLIHSMTGGGNFSYREKLGAEKFARASRNAGVRRVVYLGGLGPESGGASEHLQSRHVTAEILESSAPEFVYARAAVVLGEGSASFLMLRHLVEKLPAMICPRWIDVRTQPIASEDLVEALVHCAEAPNLQGEVQLGGKDVISYREMMLALARAEGRSQPLILKVPVLTPRLSSYWISFISSVDTGLARALVDSLKTETIVTKKPPPGINDRPMGIDQAMRRALGEED